MLGKTVSHYENLDQLGRGGMGEVYRARDVRLDREVAIKILLPASAANEELRSRFAREARAAAALSHPHICAIYDVGMEDGISFLVMELLEGQALDARLSTGTLELGQALSVGVQIVEGLKAAHERGIVHRDLKPSNIWVTREGTAKILDFGLAKLESEPVVTDVDDTLAVKTRPHTVLGSAGYMSPEQARGLPVDRRADHWALGVVLFEILSGRPLFVRDSVAESLSAILREAPSWDQLPAALPGGVRKVLDGLLCKDSVGRLANLEEVREALARALAVVTGEHAVSSVEGASIVVLPFANMSSDSENEYFADGLTEEVISDLSQVSSLRVISRTSVMRFKKSELPLGQIAAQLGVRYALEGGVRKAGEKIRITAQLIDTAHERTLWSDKYGGTLDDVFEVQEKVARAIVSALEVHLTSEEDAGLVANEDEDALVYDTWLRCRHEIMSFQGGHLDGVRKRLLKMLELRGPHPLLYKGLALVEWQYVNAGVSEDKSHLDRAEQYAARVEEFEPNGAHAPFIRGFLAVSRGDMVSWAREFGKARALEPRDSDILAWSAIGWLMAGRPDRARFSLDSLQSIDPLFDYLHFALGLVHHFEGRFDEAVEKYKRAREINPDYPGWPWMTIQGLLAAGRGEEADAELARSGFSLEPNAFARLSCALVASYRGDADEVDRLLDAGTVGKIEHDLQYCYFLCQTQAMLGRVDEAVSWMLKAARFGHCNWPYFSHVDPLIDNLRGEAAFETALEEVHRLWMELPEKVDAP